MYLVRTVPERPGHASINLSRDVAGLRAKRCSRWRESGGPTALLDFGSTAPRCAVFDDVLARRPAVKSGAGRDFGVSAELAIKHCAIAAEQVFRTQLSRVHHGGELLLPARHHAREVARIAAGKQDAANGLLQLAHIARPRIVARQVAVDDLQRER